MFIGRARELNFLEEKYSGSNGSLILVYGRRRIGKTECINYFSVSFFSSVSIN